jgi:hypothetical protein
VGLTFLFVLLSLLSLRVLEHVLPFAIVLSAFAPIPLSLIFVRRGNSAGVVACGVSMATMLALSPRGQQATVLLWLMPMMWCGAFYGFFVNARVPAIRSLVLGSLGLTIMLMGMFYNSGLHRLSQALAPAHANPVELARARAVVEPYVQALRRGQTEIMPEQEYREAFEDSLSFWGKFPLFIVGSLALLLFGGYVVLVRGVLQRIDYPGLENLEFSTWTVPWEYAWWLISACLAYVISQCLGWEWGHCISTNVALVMMLPYAVVTFSICTYILDQRRVSLSLRMLVYVVVLLNLPYLTLFAVLDSWVDCRRLARTDETAEVKGEDEED